MKKRLDMRIAAELRDGLDLRVQQTGHPLTLIVEEYIRAGLARDNGELVEQSSLPAIRQAVAEETSKSIAQLYEQLSKDLQKSARRSDDRLAALIVKAARYSGIGQRMLYSFMAKAVNPEFAQKVFESAKEQTGKDIAKPPDEKPIQS